MKKIKVSKFRQSGWLLKGTSEIHIFYGVEKPDKEDLYVKVWDNVLMETTTVEPFVEGAPIENSAVEVTTDDHADIQ